MGRKELENQGNTLKFFNEILRSSDLFKSRVPREEYRNSKQLIE